MSKIFYILTILVGSIFLTTSASAQENPEEMAKKYNVSFPIAELGNCKNFPECKAYCDSESNREACMSFAKKKGFYQEERRQDNKIMQSAKNELGCDSELPCKAICEKEENIEKCSAFAQKHNLERPRRDTSDAKILQKAKELLGCNSESSCRAVCEKEENQEKCSEFAKQAGLGGGIRRVGPGGCNSEESCRAYCEKNPEECKKFGGPPGGTTGEHRGPGGCNSEESCRKYCQENPSECQGFGSGPIENQEKFCQENPDKCSGNRDGQVSPKEYCRQNPDRCRPPAESLKNPKDSFERSSSENYNPLPIQYSDPQKTEEVRKEAQMETIQRAPENEQPSSNTTNTDRAIETPEVRGISTVRSLLDRALDLFRK